MKKTIILISLLSIFFLTAQTCSFGTTDALAAECIGVDDVVCNEAGEAYQCQLADYGLGYFTTRADGFDDQCLPEPELCDHDDNCDGGYACDMEEGVCYTACTVEGAQEAVVFDEVEMRLVIDPSLANKECGTGYACNMDDEASIDVEPIQLYECTIDTDGDGLTDEQEGVDGMGTIGYDSDHTLVDTDGDGLDDYSEVMYMIDPRNPDSDGDGVSDGDEIAAGTDPSEAEGSEEICDYGSVECEVGFACHIYAGGGVNEGCKVDTDGDGIPDEREIEIASFGVELVDETIADTDGDGLSDFEEHHGVLLDGGQPTLTDVLAYPHGYEPTLPSTADSDGDGLNDYEEVVEYETDPWEVDSDGDHLSDSDEVLIHGTDPLNYNTDGDGRHDGDEVAMGTDPLVDEEMELARITDSDLDGMADVYEDYIASLGLDDDASTYLVMDMIDDDYISTNSPDYLEFFDGVNAYREPSLGALEAVTVAVPIDDSPKYASFSNREDYMEFAHDDSTDITDWVVIVAKVRTDDVSLGLLGTIATKTYDATACVAPHSAYTLRQENSDGGFQFTLTPDGALSPTYIPGTYMGAGEQSTEEWVEVAGVWDGTTAAIFIDQVLISEVPVAGPLMSTSGPLNVGGYLNAEGCPDAGYSGDMQTLMIWGE